MEAIHTDYLVLGSGIAGLPPALGLARQGRVLVVTKDLPTESGSTDLVRHGGRVVGCRFLGENGGAGLRLADVEAPLLTAPRC